MFAYGAVVLARFDSTRFPAKVVSDFQGRPLIDAVCQRLIRGGFGPHQIAIATTSRPVDEVVAEHGARLGVIVYRGEVEDVARRCVACAESQGWGAFARVNGDSPLIDGALIHASLDAVAAGRHTFITNLSPRSYPYGVSVEAIDTPVYRESLRFANAADLEHVTRHLYRRPPRSWLNLTCPAGDLSSARLTVDTPQDRVRIIALLERAKQDVSTADPILLAKLELGVEDA